MQCRELISVVLAGISSILNLNYGIIQYEMFYLHYSTPSVIYKI